MSIALQPTDGSAGFLTHRGRKTQDAIDAAARKVIARKRILATTIADIAAEAGRSTDSLHNYYDSKEAIITDGTTAKPNHDHYFTPPGARSERADTIAKWINKQ